MVVEIGTTVRVLLTGGSIRAGVGKAKRCRALVGSVNDDNTVDLFLEGSDEELCGVQESMVLSLEAYELDGTLEETFPPSITLGDEVLAGRASHLKDCGNALFMLGDLRAAMSFYRRVVEGLEDCELGDDINGLIAAEVHVAATLNSARCYAGLDFPDRAVDSCTQCAQLCKQYLMQIRSAPGGEQARREHSLKLRGFSFKSFSLRCTLQLRQNHAKEAFRDCKLMRRTAISPEDHAAVERMEREAERVAIKNQRINKRLAREVSKWVAEVCNDGLLDSLEDLPPLPP